MPIISTDRRNKELPAPSTLHPRPCTLRRSPYILLILLLAFGTLSGCSPKSELQRAQESSRLSDQYYQQAIGRYEKLIAQGNDTARSRMELGLLYYHHGDFTQAIQELKKTQGKDAEKYLAVSYFRTGDFTDALDVFSKSKVQDEELLYYFGLTCEKLNLYDQAVEHYKKITEGAFLAPASERLNAIEKGAGTRTIKDIDPSVAAIIAQAPAQEKYPQAGALILTCDENIEATQNNTQVSHMHYLVKILNERGKKDFSEVQLEYDSTYEKVELESARTIKPDGTVLEVGSRHIRDVSKYLNFPLYSNVKVFIISFPEITEGAVIEYTVKMTSNKLINEKDFVTGYPVQTSDPVLSAHFSISLPRERQLHVTSLNAGYNTFGAELNPVKKENAGFTVYSWDFKDIPQIIPEPNMPASVEINPTILCSTFSSWQDIYVWWWKLAKDKIKADAAIKNKVAELIKNCTSVKEKAQVIHDFCAQNIRYVAIEYGQAGYEPHKAEDIFTYKYGDCKDQAILLVTMLKEAGVPAWPLLIPTKECYNLNPDFPATLFNHCIAATMIDGQIIFMDPTAETCPFGDLPEGDQGRTVLIFKEDAYTIAPIPFYPAGHNQIEQDFRIKVNGDETITAQKSIATHGVFEQGQRYWLLYTPPDQIKQVLEEKIQDISIGASLDTYNIKNLQTLSAPVVLQYTFTGPEYFTPAGDLRIMPGLTSFDTSLVAQPKRSYPIDLGIFESKNTSFEIEIPPNFTVMYLPANLHEDNAWLVFNVEYRYKDGKIYCEQKSEFKKNLIPVKEYPSFKDAVEHLAKELKQKIIVKKQ